MREWSGISLSSFRLLWVFCVLGYYEDLYSNDFNIILDFSYQNLCLNTFLYQGLMLKVDISNNIYIFIVFAIHGRLRRITCNDMPGWLTWPTWPFIDCIDGPRKVLLLNVRKVQYQNINRHISSWYWKRHLILAGDLVQLNKHPICMLLVKTWMTTYILFGNWWP